MPKFTTLLAFIMAMGTFAEGGPLPSDVPLQFVGAVRQITPPEGPGAWVVQVISRGGLGGRGASDLAITSAGGLTLSDPGPTNAVRADLLNSLGKYVRMSTPSQWTAGSKLSVCSDCVATLIVLSLRDSVGTVQIYMVFWDTTTRGNISADVLRIHDLALTARQK
jgi:hypothetical protein